MQPDDRTPERKAADERIAAEPHLPIPDVPPGTLLMSMEVALDRLNRRPPVRPERDTARARPRDYRDFGRVRNRSGRGTIPHMGRLTIDIPDACGRALGDTPEQASRQVRLAAALHLFGRGTVTQSQAAALAGIDRLAFLRACADAEVNVFQTDEDDLSDGAFGKVLPARDGGFCVAREWKLPK